MDRSSSDLLLYGKKTPSEKQRAPMRQRRNWRRCSRAPAPQHGSKPRTRASRLQNGRPAAISDSSLADLPFGGGIASIGGRTCWQGSSDFLHAPPYVQHVSTHAWHTLARDQDTLAPRVSPRIRRVSTYHQSARHVRKKKKRGKIW